MDYKIAVMTVIHGNSAGLKAVLDDIDRDRDIQHIYCLGDLIGIGHETNEVLELLFSRNDISFVKGNHDEDILKILAGHEPKGIDIRNEHHKWIASRLDKKYLQKLISIPKEKYENIGGKKFLFLHYHFNQAGAFLPIDEHPSKSGLDNESSNVDVVCFGHHHTVHHFKSKSRLYVNPGSLGCNQAPLAPYATIYVGGHGQMDVLLKKSNITIRNFCFPTIH